MTWSIEFERSAAREFRKLAPEAQRRIRHYLTARVLAQEHPRKLGKPKEPLIEYPPRDGSVAGGCGLAWASAVWLFQISEPNQAGGPAKTRPVRVSPEKPHLARCDPRP